MALQELHERPRRLREPCAAPGLRGLRITVAGILAVDRGPIRAMRNPNEPCLADLWHEMEAPPGQGVGAGSEIGTNPGPEPAAQHDPAPLLF
jgi:hypothetical protein